MSQQCELCSYSGKPVPLYPRLGIVQCPACRLVLYDQDVEPERIYTSDYFLGGEYWNYLADAATIQRNLARRVEQLRKLKPHGRLLEIGCAYGLFLQLAAQHWDVSGFDISADAVRYASHELGLDAREADFLSLAEEPDTRELICMWDTIEHLTHPVRYIEKASRWLKTGGILAITTGDINSIPARLLKERWRLIHPPTHLFYFSEATLTRAIKQAGLEVIHVSRVGYYRSIGAIVQGLFCAGGRGSSGLHRLVRAVGQINVPLYLNLHDIMLLLARKPGQDG